MENELKPVRVANRQRQDSEECIAYINPARVVCLSKGDNLLSPNGIGEYKTLIQCDGKTYFDSNNDIEHVKQELQEAEQEDALHYHLLGTGDMRKIPFSTNRFTEVYALDKPTFGNACHEYLIIPADKSEAKTLSGTICFQKGPIKETGVNGIHNEDLICIVIDRLEGFQGGEYACSENATALKSLKNALFELAQRTKRRKDAGIEGTGAVDE